MATRTEPPRTFCGVEFCDDLASVMADVAIIGAPHGTPYEPGKASHAAGGADAVRSALAWYSTGPDQLDFDSGLKVFAGKSVVDLGDVSHNLEDGAANRSDIASATQKVLERDCLPILLGGDDSTPIPFIEALSSRCRELVVVQIDAHIDWRHEINGVTHGFSSTMRRASEMDHVAGIVQIGARGPGSARQSDFEDAVAWGAQFFTARQVHKEGLQSAIESIPKGANVMLSVDVDGIDPSVVPGVILPAFGGLTYQQTLDVIEGVMERTNLVAAAFVEFVPEKDPQSFGAQAVARLVCNVINRIRS